MSAFPNRSMTVAEYLEVERKAEFRSEYYGGKMYAMAGGSRNHAVIGMNIGAEIRQRLRPTNCSVAASDLSVCVSHSEFYAYPDVVVYCGTPDFPAGGNDAILNPKVLIEVLSPSTEAYDRGFKSQQYRSIPSLEEYAFVSQHEPRVETYRRAEDGTWILTEWTGMEAECRFASLDCTIPLAEIYLKVDFQEAG